MWKRFILDESINSDFPKGISYPGNYILFFDYGNFYIGESGNVLRRLKTHIKMCKYSHGWNTEWGCFQKIEIAVREEKKNFERMMIESRFIDRLKPNLNKINGKFKKWKM